VAQGLTNESIARRLRLSPHTVDTYLRRIRAKTGTANRAQLAVLTVARTATDTATRPVPARRAPEGELPGAFAPGDPAAGPPDPASATTPVELVRQLRLLKAWAGEPSLRDLERRTGLPRSTLSQTLDTRRTTLPPLERVTAVVRACGLPPAAAERWRVAWKRVRMQHCVPAGTQPG
jgi:transcriptional regulator with XRE-family HTH domain